MNNNNNWYKHSAVWTGSMKDPGAGQYYIHAHLNKIGAMNNGGTSQFNQLESLFAKSRNNAIKASKKHYTNLLINSMSPESQNLLNSLSQNNQEQLITNMNNALTEVMKNNLPKTVIDNLIEAQKDALDLNEEMKKIINESKFQRQLILVDKILSIIQTACESLENDGENGYKVALIGFLTSMRDPNNNFKSRREIGNKMTEDLNKLSSQIIEISNRPGANVVSQAEVTQVVSTLNSLAKSLETGKTNKNEPITEQSLIRTLTNYIIPVGFGEATGLAIHNIKTDTLNFEISKILKDLESSGQRRTKIAFTNSRGNYVTKDQEQVFLGQKSAGKADIKLKNTKLSFIYNGKQQTLTFDLGISNKLYTNATINGEFSSDAKISSGQGLTLGRAIDTTFSTLNLRYLAYNTFAFQNYSSIKPALGALQDVIFQRNIVNLFGARGIDDFAAILLINGKPVALWDIIQQAAEGKLGKTMSQMTSEQQSDQLLVFKMSSERKDISIKKPGKDFYTDKKELGQAENRRRLIEVVGERARRISDAIQQTKISASLNPSKLKNLI